MRNIIHLMLLAWSCLPLLAQATDPIPVEYLWQSDPKLNVSWASPPDTPFIHLNPEQLGSSYATERMRAAQAILRVPDSPTLNRKEMLDAAIARLKSGEPDPNVRMEIVAAACELDDGQNVALLWQVGKEDRAIQSIVEAACTKWRKSEPLAIWRARLKDTQATPSQLMLAIDGVAVTGSTEDLPALKAIVLNETLAEPIRLASARAIGELAHDNQLELAKKLKNSGAKFPDLLAISVLGNSPVADVSTFVQELAEKSTAVAERAAYQWLCRHQPQVAQATAKARLTHIDSRIRSLAIDQVFELNNQETLPALIGAMDDLHPVLREQARVRILGYADRTPGQREEVYQQLSQILSHESWRPLEQAIRLSVELNRPEHVPKLIELLNHPRSEVCITAAWALRHMATDQQSLQAMFDHLTVWVNTLTDPKTVGFLERDLRRMAHLFEAMGLRRFEAAKPMVMRFVPKDPNKGLITRMTAIWACGRLWENGENKELTDELELRIADKTGMFPESPSVRFLSTIALGWVADPGTKQSLIRWNESEPSPVFFATEWALKRIEEREKK